VSISGTSSDIYDEFIFKSDKFSERIIMITPSKWFNKPDKEKLRNLLIKEGRLEKIITDNKFFEELNIRGGVSYFSTTKENKDLVNFNGEIKNLKEQFNLFGFIFKDQKESELIKSILDKTSKFVKLSTVFNSQGYFGLKTNHKNISVNGTKCYFSGRQKKELDLKTDDTNRHFSYVESFKDTKQKKDRWKVITPAAYGFKTKTENTYNQIGETFISPPGSICTETFVFFDLNNNTECESLKIYLDTNFVKFFVSVKKNKQHVTSKIFDIIPMVPFDREWTDGQLFEYFNLTEEERNLILNHSKK
jgi:site-specific DNA-methyltransferase (adenine-specific)